MVLAVLLLILSGITTFAVVFTMVFEKAPAKRAMTLVFSTAYVVVMVLAAVALM